MTLCLFRHFSKTNHPLTYLDGYLLEPGWLILEWANWRLEVDHDPKGWLARLSARVVPMVPRPAPLTS